MFLFIYIYIFMYIYISRVVQVAILCKIGDLFVLCLHIVQINQIFLCKTEFV